MSKRICLALWVLHWACEAIAPAIALAGAPAIYNLGSLGGSASYGYSINASGQVVGNSYTTGDAARHAFLYTGTPGSGGQMIDLGTLGGTGSGAAAINASGQIAGDSETIDGATHAFLYTGTPGSSGTMVDLGTIGGKSSLGLAINDSGQIAGWARVPGLVADHAFLYTGTPGSGGQMIDLGTIGDGAAARTRSTPAAKSRD